jgi:hypothetical protein
MKLYFISYFYFFQIRDPWLKFQPVHMLAFAGAQIRSCIAQLHLFTYKLSLSILIHYSV